MKYRFKIGAVMAFAAMASGASAESNVTLYGVVDVGIEYANHQAGGGKDVVRETAGNISGSRWGLRGTEDLGSGLKGLFLLESGFDPDTGKSGQGNRLFGRSAYVGLSQAGVGSLLLGRQQNLLFDFVASYDPMGLAPRYSIFTQDLGFVGRSDNTVKYVGTFGGLTAAAMYSFGAESGTVNGSEVPGHAKLGREYGARLDYSVGRASFGGAYDEINTGTLTTNPDATTRRATFAGTYAFDKVTAYAGYRWANASGGARLPGTASAAATQGSNLWWAGARWQVTPAIMLAGAAYYQDFRHSGADPWLFVGFANYAFSKRTDVYLSAAYTKNKNGSALGAGQGAAGWGNTDPGMNQFAANVGVRHKF